MRFNSLFAAPVFVQCTVDTCLVILFSLILMTYYYNPNILTNHLSKRYRRLDLVLLTCPSTFRTKLYTRVHLPFLQTYIQFSVLITDIRKFLLLFFFCYIRTKVQLTYLDLNGLHWTITICREINCRSVADSVIQSHL